MYQWQFARTHALPFSVRKGCSSHVIEPLDTASACRTATTGKILLGNSHILCAAGPAHRKAQQKARPDAAATAEANLDIKDEGVGTSAINSSFTCIFVALCSPFPRLLVGNTHLNSSTSTRQDINVLGTNVFRALLQMRLVLLQGILKSSEFQELRCVFVFISMPWSLDIHGTKLD